MASLVVGQAPEHSSGPSSRDMRASLPCGLSPFFKDGFFIKDVIIFYFTYFWLYWVSVAACQLFLVAASRGHSLAMV